jgi:hypothetical protein
MCNAAQFAALFFTLVLGSHAMLSGGVARGAQELLRQLNPVSSGAAAAGLY